MVNAVPQELIYSGDRAEILLDKWYNIKVVTDGDLLQLYIDDVLVLEIRDSTHPAGAIGIRMGFTYSS